MGILCMRWSSAQVGKNSMVACGLDVRFTPKCRCVKRSGESHSSECRGTRLLGGSRSPRGPAFSRLPDVPNRMLIAFRCPDGVWIEFCIRKGMYGSDYRYHSSVQNLSPRMYSTSHHWDPRAQPSTSPHLTTYNVQTE